MADGLLLSRKEKVRVFWLKFLYGAGPSLALVVFALAIGAGAVGWTIAVFGVLLGFLVATNARTYRGALVGGIAVALVLLLFQVVVAWFVTHPIQKG
jgi:hypothetical protein